ncbi:DUF977 family protein [Shigella flexneri]|uniref:DUF977 family protein n=1 Tax=Shigella flexneri TaxID=623 RepID=UPI0035A9A0B4
MAKPFTPEQREELKTRIVELVHQDGRVTIRSCQMKQVSVVRLSVAYAWNWSQVVMYNSGYGVFPSEQAHKDWQTPAKAIEGKGEETGCG